MSSPKSTSPKSAKPRASKMSKRAARAEGAAKTDRLRKAALKEVQSRIADQAAVHEPAQAKAKRAGRKPIETKHKKVSGLDAAAIVLASAKAPMRVGEILAEIQTRGLWASQGGKTPQATLYAAMIREIAAKAKDARFLRGSDKGTFVAAA